MLHGAIQYQLIQDHKTTLLREKNITLMQKINEETLHLNLTGQNRILYIYMKIVFLSRNQTFSHRAHFLK